MRNIARQTNKNRQTKKKRQTGIQPGKEKGRVGLRVGATNPKPSGEGCQVLNEVCTVRLSRERNPRLTR